MTYRISPTPWRVDMDCIMDGTGERILRALPQDNSKGLEDGELARYQLQLASCAPELLAACVAVELACRSGNYAEAFALIPKVIAKATTVDFMDGNAYYPNLAAQIRARNAK